MAQVLLRFQKVSEKTIYCATSAIIAIPAFQLGPVIGHLTFVWVEVGLTHARILIYLTQIQLSNALKTAA